MSDSEDRMKTAVGNIKQARNLLGDANSALNDVQGETSKLRRENKRLVELQLPEGIEWPRFEDGEPVKIGDEVEFDGEAAKVLDVAFSAEGFSLFAYTATASGRVYGAFGERVKRPTPKVLDADGVSINVGDTVYCDGEDEALTVTSISGVGGEYCCVTVKNADSSHCTVDALRLTHELPDSWRLWGDDLDMAVKVGEVDKVEMMRRAKALSKGGQR